MDHQKSNRGGEKTKKIEQGKMTGKKFMQRETQREKNHAEEGSHFCHQTGLIITQPNYKLKCSKRWCY